ncbi:MICAL-like protein 2 [Acipenser ruthenus]|uniref:MICAL-like protein 2 n=1 Tax=Acipenser ruthenus TaxID=7906 RepID=A0A662YZS1_ACIRT|nr:MICAL-like protein 2 [Acipenser ruthenus]
MASSIKALQQWCKIQCDGYRDVAITNMTTSFRDGLAFCALIHKHRASLIDFDSLNKENVFENNSLAFRVAEEKLGIPALLDAEDMVALRIPDRLSILTYVSQYYNCFHGRSPIGGLAGIKRPTEDSKEEPAGKKHLPVMAKQSSTKQTKETENPPTIITTASSKPAPATAKAAEPKKVLVESTNKTGSLSSTCAVCKNHVHLVQRHLVDGKLYHRNCFRCKQCSNILLSGTYKPGPESGTFICTTHQHNQNKSTPSPAGFTRGGTYNNSTAVPAKTGLTSVAARNQSPAVTLPTSSVTTTVSYNVKPSVVTTPTKPWTPTAEKTQMSREKFFQSSHVTPINHPTNSLSAVNVVMPGKPASSLQTGNDKDKARSFLTQKLPLEGNSNNNNHTPLTPASSGVVKSTESQFTSRNTEVKDKPSTSFTSKVKEDVPSKPRPFGASFSPTVRPASEDVSLASAESVPSTPSTDCNEDKSSPKQTSNGTGTNSKWSFIPATGVLGYLTLAYLDYLAVNRDVDFSKSPSDKDISSSEVTSAKPGYIPEEEIQEELKGIEAQLNELEKKGVEMEKDLRSCEGDESEEVLMVDWFKLIRQKQLLMRRESELVYISKTQDLEGQQPGVEGELRRLMEKPEHLKTEADRKREEELMLKLVDIVNDRNAIIDGLDEDRLRMKV